DLRSCALSLPPCTLSRFGVMLPRRSPRCQGGEWPAPMDSSPQPASPVPIMKDRARCIVARRAGDAAAGMRARAAMVEAGDGAAVVRVAQHRPRPEQLVKRQCAMEDVAADEPERLLEVERAQRLAADDARLEARRVTIDRVDHQV